MAIAVEREQIQPTRALVAIGELGWLAIAGAASLSAGAIHAAAIGIHSEHRQAVVAFTLAAAIQIGFGAFALARPGRVLLSLGALANAGFFAVWVTAKTTGISFIDGLEDVEPVQLADALAAGLAMASLLAVGALLLDVGDRALQRSPLLTGTAAVLIAALSVPGMLSAGSHAHSEGSAAGDGHGHGDAHAAAADDAATHAEVQAFDPALPIDLSGMDGVTPQQQAEAENILASTLVQLPQFSDFKVAESLGFVSIGDGFLGEEHYLNQANMRDDRILDPSYPESLVYDTTVEPKRLVAAMFMLNEGDTLADVPAVGGDLMQWHMHNNLCFAGPRVAGLTDAEGNCAQGLTKGAETPMIHVWIVPHPCGPFAALEGVGAGQIAEGETRLCDAAHGGAGH